MELLHAAEAVRVASGPAWLRPLSGLEEQGVAGAGSGAALALLDRLLVAAPGACVGPGEAASLPAGERDRLLAAVYRRAYGPRISSVASCSGCGEAFDVDFALDDLLAAIEGDADPDAVAALGDGTFAVADGVRFRLPTGVDEVAVAGADPADAARLLLERVLVAGDPARDGETVERALESVSPLVERELEVACPECGCAQRVRFDVQSYLLDALASERGQLAREVHALASAYGWALGEILALPRPARRAYAELAEAPRRSG